MREQGCLVNAESMGADITSRAIQFDNVTRMSIHIIMTGSPVGVVSLQCSNDLVSDHSSDTVTNWVDYTDGSSVVSGADQVMFNIRDVSFKWIRLVYVRGSGTGSMTTNFYSVTDAR